MNKKRIKAQTLQVPQSKEQTQSWIKLLGDVEREKGREAAKMNDSIAEISDAAKPKINELQARAKELQIGIQTWCEANRSELTSKSKTANLITGEISWRQRPPSISLRGIDTILDNLKSLGLARFIRTKDEINKDAMLNEADVAASVAGVTIKTGVEDFIIKPFEANIED